MENKNKKNILQIPKNKIVIIFGTIFILSLILLFYIINLKNEIALAKEKMDEFSFELDILDKNKKLSTKWQEYEEIILEKRRFLAEEKAKLEDLENKKYELEQEIQKNRAKIVK